MVSSVLAAGLTTVYQQLTAFAGLESFWTNFDSIFGTGYNIAVASSLRSQWQSGNFSQLPTIEVIDDQILGNARGAYGSSTNVIYLAASLVETASPQQLEAVILEEIGHFVDAQVNATDTAGDEGELFSAIVRGINVSAAELVRIKGENDQAAILVNGLAVAVEQSVTQVGKWDYLSYAHAVAVVGNYAYAVGDTLEIIDISNPSNSVFKSNYDINYGQDIQVVGNYAYIADGNSGLQIINISNPALPSLVGTYDTTGYAYGVQVVGNYAYVADGNSGLQIINISNPAAPSLSGSYDTTGYAKGVQVVGNYAYVADYESGLQIINISNPTAPSLSGSYDSTGYANGVEVVGNYAYVADSESGLQIINISNPAAPSFSGSYDTTGYAYGVQVVGNYAYVADDSSGLQIINISNPAAPSFSGSYDTTGYAYGVQVVGNYAYVADWDSGLQIINISNSAAPSLAGTYDTTGGAYGVEVVGNYAYVADFYSGLQIINISNPAAPSLSGSYDTTGFAYGVQVVGNYAYVADYASGLQIINISNPAAPTLTGTYDTTYIAYGVQVVGNYAYVADGSSGLQIINISNPTAPTLAGTYDTTGYAYGVEVVGNYAYVADLDSGLQIINISNPTAPTLAGTYDTTGYALGVQVVGNYAYVADYDGGLKILNVSDFTGSSTNLSIAATNAIQLEGNSGSTAFTFTVTRTGDTTNTDTVQWAVTGTGTNPANAADFGGGVLPSGLVTFGTHITSQVISVPVSGDTTFEPDETFSLTLTNPSNGTTIATATATGTIQNDNDSPTLAINDITVVEGKDTNAFLTVSLSYPISQTVSVNYTTTAINATAGSDYTTTSGILTLAPNSTFATISIPILNDNINESLEAFTVNLSNPVNAKFGTNTNDSIGEVTISDTWYSELTSTLPNGVENLTLIGVNAINGTGNSGNNILTGNSANNTLDGSTGVDTLIGGFGNDIYQVDSTTDIITENAGEGIDTIQSSVTYTISSLVNIENLTLTGSSVINGTGNAANNSLTGNTANNTLNGSDGNDTLNGGAGNDTLIGGNGNDLAYYYSSTASVTVNLAMGTANDGLGGTDTLSQIENVQGSNTAGDNLTGDANNNTLYGYGGNDTLNGGDGNDLLIGGTGNDSLIGGNGTDIAYYYLVTGAVTANLVTGIASDGEGGTDTLSQIENIQGSNTAGDNLTGNTGVNTLYGYGGADILTGGGGNDLLSLGSDTFKDTVNYASGDGVDTVYNFVRGAGGDLLKFTSIAAIDVQVSGTNTLFKVGDGISGNSGFGSGTLLLTTSATTGFVAADVNVNLLGATFAFS